MASNTGVVRSFTMQGLGDNFPLVNSFNHFRLMSGFRNRRVYAAKLTGTAAAIGTDDYTFTLFVADRGLLVDACYVIDPIGVAVNTTNDNNFTLKRLSDDTTMCAQSTQYGVVANEPWEVTRANSVANRTLAAGDTATLVIDGDNAGQVINHGTLVFVVCSLA